MGVTASSDRSPRTAPARWMTTSADGAHDFERDRSARSQATIAIRLFRARGRLRRRRRRPEAEGALAADQAARPGDEHAGARVASWRGPPPRFARVASSSARSSRSAARAMTAYVNPERRAMSSRLEPTIALVQHPEQGALVIRSGHGSARRPIETAPPELWLAEWTQVDAAPVRLEHLDELEAPVNRLRQRLGPDPLQPVRRRVIAAELPVWGAHQGADREVEPRGAELALVAAPWLPGQQAMRRARSRRTISMARSTSASPRRLRL